MRTGTAHYKPLIIYAAYLASREIVLERAVDLEKLVAGAAAIEISHDCGKFVCVRLVSSKEYLSQKQLTVRCIFAHVPVLTQENLMGFLQIPY
ncbi:hypothetical protein KBT16_05645 [Nostoc sp. CCCryo 231-06]|nr:hypothetical protein [Nostoc sp. CCCryo 231-06]